MWKDSEAEIDLLHFDYLVKAVKMIAEDTNLTPSTIGIYGDWGSGKSSLMKMVCKELSDKEGIKCINALMSMDGNLRDMMMFALHYVVPFLMNCPMT